MLVALLLQREVTQPPAGADDTGPAVLPPLTSPRPVTSEVARSSPAPPAIYSVCLLRKPLIQGLLCNPGAEAFTQPSARIVKGDRRINR